HRFESGYNTRLVGKLPEAHETYIANSAITLASKIRSPLLLLHGTADNVVPPSQSAALEAIVTRSGTPVERHLYEGEGHGWRRAAVPTAHLCSKRQCARPRPSCRNWRRFRPSDWCSAGGRWAVASARWSPQMTGRWGWRCWATRCIRPATQRNCVSITLRSCT